MKNVVIGTAGHVDHGKTALIKALTGIDCDRLKEEKTRGITIENGFAYMENDRGFNIGIIDVPGHEKFVRNMLAGIGGVNIVLVVISLEEGIKPQTIEHLEIIKSLGIKNGIIVFTKIDSQKEKVDFENLKCQVKSLLEGSSFKNAKMICVSSVTGYNIDLLKEEIFNIIECDDDFKTNYDILENTNTTVMISKNINENVRLPIDRVFTLAGFGTIVTGTLIEGKIGLGDELMLYPSEKIIKVRNIQVYGKNAQVAYKAERVAINLQNISKDEIHRGDVLATKNSITLSRKIKCSLTMFKSFPKKLKNNQKVHFNFGAKQVDANVRIPETSYNENTNVDEHKVLFRFEKPIPIKVGDKFIIRDICPELSSGGGVVTEINIENDINKITDKAKNRKLRIDNYMLQNDTDLKNEGLLKNSKLLNIISNINECISDSKFVEDDLNSDKLQIKNKITINTGIMLSEQDVERYNEIEKKYLDLGIAPLDNESIINIFVKNKSVEEKETVKKILVDLAKNKKLIKLSENYYMHENAVSFAVNKAIDYLKINGKIRMAELRDILQTSRKYAILIIDYMDKKRITKLVNDYRILYQEKE